MIGEIITCAIITIFTTNPGSQVVGFCLGRREIYYNFDYFNIGGQSRVHVMCNFENIYLKWACYICQVIKKPICSNLIEIFFITRILMTMKIHTNSIVNLVTPKVLEERKWLVIYYLHNFQK